MTIDNIKTALETRISGWYTNARIDYGITGRFVDAIAYGDKLQHLRITWEEDGKRYALNVAWYTEYTAEQIYNIWMEGDDIEELYNVEKCRRSDCKGCDREHCASCGDLINELRATQQAAPVEQPPADKAAALVEELATLDGITATIKGAQTAAPVVWLAGETDAHKAKIESMGGKWSGKRAAWYFKIA